jgi:chemotaxis protein MotA
MFVIIGTIVVLISVLGGFLLSSGHLLALWQPYEFLIIFGGAIGAFIVANPPSVAKSSLRGLMGLFKGPTYGKQDYIDLLSMLYDLFSAMRKEGLLALEAHIEEPSSSPIFSAYPRLVREHHLIDFTTDCLRLIVGGNMNPHELEALLDVELETHHAQAEAPSLAIAKVADALPGFGIVAAVLGIVTTMSQLGGDTSRIGEHIAGALVGTFLGILLSYGFVGPLAAAMEGRAQEDGKAFECVKVALLSSLRGYNPMVAVEFGRKTLSSLTRPTFVNLEGHLKGAR